MSLQTHPDASRAAVAFDAAGLAVPWNPADVRPLPAPGARAAALPGSLDDEEEDAAAPTVADPAPDGPPTRTVGPR